ncbi:peptidase inhibitor family I36 protein [Pseudomonas sp. p50]|uniref:peptidase inhibitor family I36 protein n=1 Tax=Pseudomonas sp. p50(2008) TaxID=2816832 RepID=UPI00188A8D89|nr:peptidase inhibitor family I36 protein [Pseudomonas sp. p50(2008)]MBF4560157.1 peptidase inhibitor family I36 protein [Pseudomonas sp. p50(2008)]
MVIRLILVIFALCVGVFVLFFFYAKDAVGEKSRFAVINPPMNAAQTVAVQQRIDEQLIRKGGGEQISSTQLVYENGAVIVAFPVPGDVQGSDGICDYGYFCVWENRDYTGKKLSVLSKAANRPINLSDYNMSKQVSSWQHNNRVHTVKIFGVDGPDAIGNMMMSNIKEVGLGRGCCPFSFPEKAVTPVQVTELYSQNELIEQSDRMVSVAFSPMFILFAQ